MWTNKYKLRKVSKKLKVEELLRLKLLDEKTEAEEDGINVIKLLNKYQEKDGILSHNRMKNILKKKMNFELSEEDLEILICRLDTNEVGIIRSILIHAVK